MISTARTAPAVIFVFRENRCQRFFLLCFLRNSGSLKYRSMSEGAYFGASGCCSGSLVFPSSGPSDISEILPSFPGLQFDHTLRHLPVRVICNPVPEVDVDSRAETHGPRSVVVSHDNDVRPFSDDALGVSDHPLFLAVVFCRRVR